MEPKIYIRVQPADRSRAPELRPVIVNEATIDRDLIDVLGLRGRGDFLISIEPNEQPTQEK